MNELEACGQRMTGLYEINDKEAKIASEIIHDSKTGARKALSLEIPKKFLKSGTGVHELVRFMNPDDDGETVIIRLEINNNDPYIHSYARITDKKGFLDYLDSKTDAEGIRIFQGLDRLPRILLKSFPNLRLTIDLVDEASPSHLKRTAVVLRTE